MNKRKYIIIGILTSVIIIAMVFFVSYQKQSEVKEDTMSYLTEKGYDVENDIQTAEVYKIMERTRSDEVEFKGNYEVAVTFKNEPGVTYFYAYKTVAKEVEQIVVTPSNKGTNEPLKHKESEQVQVLN